jgi:predicted short-subunit dehydrogenase-like oxidoreductase (DUF2520 family)
LTRTLAMVGAGRVGRGLGARLREAGWTIGAVVARRLASARAAVRAIGGGTPAAGITRRLLVSDVILLAVPDHALRDVARELAHAGGTDLRGKTLLHTSGALSADVLEPLAECGARTGTLHPMQTFGARSRPRLEGVLFGVDGHVAALRVARSIAHSLGGTAVRIAPGKKVEYHCAGTFAASHVLTAMEAGVRLLLAAGLKRKEATRVLLRLARQTLDNMELLGPRAAWTGPLSRSDLSTIALHWEALSRYPAEYRPAYAGLTRLAARLLADLPGPLLERLDNVLAPSSPADGVTEVHVKARGAAARGMK